MEQLYSHLTKDAFIYATHQAAEARGRPDGQFQSHLRFVPFLEKTWSLPTEPHIANFKSNLLAIIEHHAQVSPQYKRQEELTIETISWFAHSVATLFADINQMVISYTGCPLPLLETTRIPRTTSSKHIGLAIEKFQQFCAENPNEKFDLAASLEAEDYSQFAYELWSLIFYFSKKAFGEYTDLISSYALWKYVAKETSQEIIDWNVRPPCGEAYRRQFKHLFERDYGRNGGNKSGGRPTNKGPALKSPEPVLEPVLESLDEALDLLQANDIQEAVLETDKIFVSNETPRRPSATNGGDRPYGRSSQQSPSGDNAQTDRRSTSRAHSSGTFEADSDSNTTDANTQKALDEVSRSIKRMLSNSDMAEICLSPQNSFLRRQQHVLIAEAGFDTESRGADDNRYVCLKRR